MSTTINAVLDYRWTSATGRVHRFPDEPEEETTTTTGNNSLENEMDLTTTPATLVVGNVALAGEIVVHNPNVAGNVIFTLDGVAALFVAPGKTGKFSLAATLATVQVSISAGTGRVSYRITDP